MSTVKPPVGGSTPCLSPPPKPVVYVLDDDVSMRESLGALIRCAGWRPEVFGSTAEFLAYPRARVPSCLVLGVSLPDRNGLDVQKCVAAEWSDMPIIIIADYGDVSMAVRAMKAGAAEFLIKPLNDEVLLRGIRQAIERSRSALVDEDRLRTIQNRHASLSLRERQVMELVVRGLLNKQVGAELGISEVTVKAHRGRVMQKMRADSLAGLVNMAVTLSAHARIAQPSMRAPAYKGGRPIQDGPPPRDHFGEVWMQR